MPTPDFDERHERWEIDPAWSLGAQFGGAVLADALELASADPAWTPVAASATFLRPVAPGLAEWRVQRRRSGRRRLASSLQLSAGDQPLVSVEIDAVPRAGRPEWPAAPVAGLPAPAAPARGDLGALVDWRAESRGRSWFRLRSGGSGSVRGLAIAADLLGPAVIDQHAAPFRVATTALNLVVHATSRSSWLALELEGGRSGGWASGRVVIRDPAGRLLASASQTAVLVAAAHDELPSSVTGFGWGRQITVFANE